MNHLPKYWAIKIDKEHPLWNKFKSAIEKISNIFEDVDEDSYEYLLKNKNEDDRYSGFDMWMDADFKRDYSIITLEDFFQQSSYEIY